LEVVFQTFAREGVMYFFGKKNKIERRGGWSPKTI